MQALFVYVTAPSREEALTIAETVVNERLAACANILPGMTSICRWQSAVQRAEEAVLILKTRESLFPALATRVRELHSYETPCIAALPLQAGEEAFIKWIFAETDDMQKPEG